MNRSISAVLLGTFTLRFSTGLTGGLLVYYLDALPEYGGVQVASTTVGILTATYFLAELVLSRPSGTCRIATARTGSCRSARSSEWWRC